MRIKIILLDNKSYEADFVDFTMANFLNEINTNSDQMMQFGGVGVAKRMIKAVEPLEEEIQPVEEMAQPPVE